VTVLRHRAAAADDAPAVAELLAAAFADYPIWVWVEPDDAERRRALRDFYEADTADTMALGSSDLLFDEEGRLLAAAIWVPSEHLQGGFLTAPELESHWSPSAGSRLHSMMRVMEEMAPPEPHWYLDLLAVDPARQGGGLGGLVLAPGLARAEADGRPCVLETARPQTVRFYERLGFAVTEEVDLAPGVDGGPGPALWGMSRPPAA
jgi:ribosomal protein S18 acetylase RimI-like enzyme